MEFTTIASGSSGNCIYIKGGSTRVLVDVGCSMKHVRESLAALGTDIREIDAILITHEHTDHAAKAPMLSRRFDIPIYASPLTWESLPFYGDYFPWERHIFDYGMEIGDLGLDFFKLSHDAVQPVGMVFFADGQKVGVATDTGKVTRTMLDRLYDADGLVFEANHDMQMLMQGPYPVYLKRRIASSMGHLSNDEAGEALCSLMGPHTTNVLLAHLSRTNNLPQLAYGTVCRRLAEAGICTDPVSVAPRMAVHSLICLDKR